MKYILFIISVIMLNACQSSVNQDGFKEQNLNVSELNEIKCSFDGITEIKVPSDSWNKPPKEIYNLIDTIFAVKLETNKRNIIGNIDEIKIYNDRIYVLDKGIAKMIYVFDINGRFIGQIGRKGRGPGEYQTPEGIEIDKVNNELIVVSVANRKFLRYDLVGNFLGDFDVEVAFVDFKILENGNFVLLAGDEPNTHLGKEMSKRIIYITDNRGNIVSYGPKYCTDFEDVKIRRLGNLMVQNNEISYAYKFSDTIFQVNNNELTAKYKIDLGSYALNRERLKNLSTQDFINASIKLNNPIDFTGEHFQTKDYLLFRITINRSLFSLYYNKKCNKLFTSLSNPIDESYWMGSWVSSYQDYFIASMNAHELLSSMENLKKNYPYRLNNMYAKLGWNQEFDISDSDNPILFFYKFKIECCEE